MTTATAEHLPATLTAKTLEKFAVTTAAIAKIAADTLAISVRDHGIKEVERSHKDLKKLNADIEARRVELKAPAWAECQAIDSVAKQLKESLAPSLEHLAEERKIYDDAIEEKKRQAREAERQKIQSRIDRLTAAKLPVDLMAVQTLADAAFESMVTDGLQAIAEAEEAAAEAKAAEEARAAEAARIAAEEMARQQEELRIRAEELAAERRKMQEATAEEARRQAEAKAEADEIRAAVEAVRQAEIAEERRKLDEERQMVAAEQARIKAEEAKRQAEIAAAAKIERDRIKAIEEAENLRQWQESQEREKEAKEAAAAALLPELEKAEAFANFIDVQAAVWLKKNGDPAWTKKAMGLLDVAFEGLIDYIKKHQ